LFAPIIVHPVFELLGHGPVPAARPTRFAELMRPDLDAQWVEVSGVVRSVVPRQGMPRDTVMEVVADELRIGVMLNGVAAPDAAHWIDDRVAFRALCLHRYNANRQYFGVLLAVPKGERVRIEEVPPMDPYSRPLQMPRDLRTYRRSGSDEHRVHLRGQVSHVIPGSALYLQHGREGIEVRTRQADTVSPGTTIDVVGFVADGNNGPRLADAEFRVVAAASALEPVTIAPEQAGEWDNVLVRTQGRLVSTLRERGEVTCVFSSDHGTFVGTVPVPPADALPDAWRPGALFQLTGICVVALASFPQNEFEWRPAGFRLLLRNPDDLVVLQPAPWLTTEHVLRAIVVVLGLIAVALAGLFVRYRMRAIEQRQYRFAAEREFAAVLSERNRVAREIHDTLAQGLTSISAQLELAKETVATAPERAQAALAHARESVRSSLADARRTVWALRPQVLESRDLRAALAVVGKELTAGTPVSVIVTQVGREDRLPPGMDVELLRIGQEAMTNAIRHAQPTFVVAELHYGTEAVTLRVLDNGRGISNRATEPDAPIAGFGLTGIRERATQLGGSFEIRDREGGGTEVVVIVPLSV
jgi:signal transduction histidine kinase